MFVSILDALPSSFSSRENISVSVKSTLFLPQIEDFTGEESFVCEGILPVYKDDKDKWGDWIELCVFAWEEEIEALKAESICSWLEFPAIGDGFSIWEDDDEEAFDPSAGDLVSLSMMNLVLSNRYSPFINIFQLLDNSPKTIISTVIKSIPHMINHWSEYVKSALFREELCVTLCFFSLFVGKAK